MRVSSAPPLSLGMCASVVDAPVVRLDKVEKWFGRTSALQGVNLTVQPGEFLVFLGRNGAGKSTLAARRGTIGQTESGRVEVCGIDVLRHPEAGGRSLGFVAHSSYLYRNLTAFENLQFLCAALRARAMPKTEFRRHSVGSAWRKSALKAH